MSATTLFTLALAAAARLSEAELLHQRALLFTMGEESLCAVAHELGKRLRLTPRVVLLLREICEAREHTVLQTWLATFDVAAGMQVSG